MYGIYSILDVGCERLFISLVVILINRLTSRVDYDEGGIGADINIEIGISCFLDCEGKSRTGKELQYMSVIYQCGSIEGERFLKSTERYFIKLQTSSREMPNKRDYKRKLTELPRNNGALP